MNGQLLPTASARIANKVPCRRVVRAIEEAVDCSQGDYKVARKISGDGCSISLKDVEGLRIVVDLHPKSARDRKGEKKGDFLFVGKVKGDNSKWIAVLELKSGSYDAGIIEQLQAGARAAESLIPENFCAIFRPIAVVGGRYDGSPQNWNKEENKIKFRNRRIAIHVTRCKSILKEALVKKKK